MKYAVESGTEDLALELISWAKDAAERKQKTIKISLLILYFSLTRKLNTILKKKLNSHYVKNTVCLFYVNEKIYFTKEMHLNW